MEQGFCPGLLGALGVEGPSPTDATRETWDALVLVNRKRLLGQLGHKGEQVESRLWFEGAAAICLLSLQPDGGTCKQGDFFPSPRAAVDR